MKFPLCVVLATLVVTPLTVTPAAAEQWSVPLAGNAFRTAPEPGGARSGRDAPLRLQRTDEAFSVYFHADRPGVISLALQGRALRGEATIQAQFGDKTLSTELRDAPTQDYPLGEVTIAEPGYVRVDLQRLEGSGAATAEASALVVSSDVEGMRLDFVQNNDGNMFYWGRRGPSVHLAYQLPSSAKLTHAYCEVTVPVGQDPIGSYFMANGFGEGYFGFQVNGADERRVLFSVWSPFRTDNPAEIPTDERVVTLAKGERVHAQDFGNEGSGGQSHLIYPWQAGRTYRFLTQVEPDGQGATRYTSWFGDKQKNEWLLIASFRRPKTDKHLTGFHSFLESFSPDYGYVQRSAHYGNQWVRDVEGQWRPITRARFTGDNTARGRHRLDYAGGVEGGQFFLKNCGFFSEAVELDQVFEREASSTTAPMQEGEWPPTEPVN